MLMLSNEYISTWLVIINGSGTITPEENCPQPSKEQWKIKMLLIEDLIMNISGTKHGRKGGKQVINDNWVKKSYDHCLLSFQYI